MVALTAGRSSELSQATLVTGGLTHLECGVVMPDLRAPLQLRPFALHDVRVVEGWLCGNGLSLPAGLLRHEWPQRLLADPRIVAQIATVAGREVGFVRLDCGPDQVAEVTLV